jgi:hypothetical protein
MTAKSRPPVDKREYIRMSVDFPTHPKLMQLPEEVIPLAGWLTANAWCYCGENKTDGEFPPNLIYRTSFVDKEIGKELIAVGLWHEAGHDCPKCPQPKDRMLISHDYLEHQRSKEEVESLRSARSGAGAKGAQKRWANRKPIANAMASATADAKASAMANGWQVDGKPIAEVEVEVEKEPNPSVTPSGATVERPRKQPRRAEPGHLFDEDTASSRTSAQTQTQLLVAAYCEAVVAVGGVHTEAMRGAIGRNVKALIEKDHIDPAVLLVAVQRAGAARAKNVDRYLGDVQSTFDRSNQGHNAMRAAWFARAAEIDNAMQQPQIGA